MLALAVLLVTLGAARGNCDARPKMTVTASRTRITGSSVALCYGEDVTVHCSADDSASLSIVSMENVQTTIFNATTIQYMMMKPNLGWHDYFCTDKKTGCGTYLIVTVRPLLSVTAPGVRHALIYAHKLYYYVPPGEEYEVICSGDESGSLEILDSINSELEILVVNDTTVNLKRRAGRKESVTYYCNGNNLVEAITVVVDAYPKGLNFSCISNQDFNLECSWLSSSKRNTFKLFQKFRYYGDFETYSLICTHNAQVWNRICTSHINLATALVLEACNEVFCDNQTFPFDVYDNIKLDPVSDLRLLNTSSRNVLVAWRITAYFRLPHLYKIEYRMLTTAWQRVNTSSFRCDSENCQYILALPCPDTHYELRVYVKLETAVGERFWAEPSSKFFFTAPSNTDDVLDPACTAKFVEKAPISTDTVLYEVRRLVSYEREQNSALKNRVRALKLKRDKIKALTESISAFNP